jgi:hypothetical protein
MSQLGVAERQPRKQGVIQDTIIVSRYFACGLQAGAAIRGAEHSLRPTY